MANRYCSPLLGTKPFGEPDGKAQKNFTDPDSRIMNTSRGFEQCFNAQIAVGGASLMIVANSVTQSASDSRQLKPMLDKVRRNTKRGQKEYRKRKHIAEPPFGRIKSVLGFRSFSVRGYAKVTAEWDLVCLALNLKRMNSQMTWVG